MNKLAMVTAAAVSLTLGHAASADDDFWVGVKAGTLGLGLEATWRPVPYLDVRGGYNAYNYEDTSTEAGVTYDGELDLSTFYATANLRVPLSPFRVTAGVFSNKNEIVLNSQEGGTIQIGNTTYTSAEIGSLQARGTFDSFAPYAGIGLDFRIADTVALIFDAGVLFQGKISVDASATGPLSSDPAFLAELEAERQELEDSVDDYEYYPVVSLGFSVNF